MFMYVVLSDLQLFFFYRKFIGKFSQEVVWQFLAVETIAYVGHKQTNNN